MVTRSPRGYGLRLTLPVLAVGGARYSGAMVAETMRLAADDVSEVVLDDCGHYVAEEQPARFTEILRDFLGGTPGSRCATRLTHSHSPANVHGQSASCLPPRSSPASA